MFKRKKAVAIIQARMGSTRFPGKVLKPIEGKTSIQHIVERVRMAKSVDDIIVATSRAAADKKIVEHCRDELGVVAIQGSENDVIGRVLKAAEFIGADIIVDITGDCPLVDPEHIEALTRAVKKKGYDYASNIVPRKWPDGFDVQVYGTKLLEMAYLLIENPAHYSHVGWNIVNQAMTLTLMNGDKLDVFSYPPDDGKDYSYLEVTLDEPADLKLISALIQRHEEKATGRIMSADDVIYYLEHDPDLMKINRDVKRKVPGEG